MLFLKSNVLAEHLSPWGALAAVIASSELTSCGEDRTSDSKGGAFGAGRSNHNVSLKNVCVLIATFLITVCSSFSALAEDESGIYFESSYTILDTSDSILGNFTLPTLKATLGKSLHENLDGELTFATGISNSSELRTTPSGLARFDANLSTAYSLYLRPKVMLEDSIELFARIGYFRGKYDVSAHGAVDWATQARGGSFSHGLGVKIDFSKDYYFVSDYMRYYARSNGTIDGFSLGLGYRF